MIVVEDLYDYMYDLEEDPICDGPILLSKKEQEEFINYLDKNIIQVKELFETGLGGGNFNQEQENYLMNTFVDFLNNKGYTEEDVKYGDDLN